MNEVFKKNLVNCLAKKNLNQVDVANSIGVSKGTVSMWCNGLSAPRGVTLVRLANYLSVTPEMLLNERSVFTQLDEETLIHDYRMLSQTGKEKLRERMDELKQLYWYEKAL